jgi:hypothetical protein
MPRLLQNPAVIDMRFVRPQIKKGDFYLFKSPVSGRNLYVYPRMMGERCTDLESNCQQRYAVTERLGGLGVNGRDAPEDAGSFLSYILGTPQRIAAGVEETRQRVERTERLLTVTLAASLIASGLFIWKTLKE